MVLHEAKQTPRKFLLLRPRNLDDSKKGLFMFSVVVATPYRCRQLDAFQRAIDVFTIVLCRRRRRPHCLLLKSP